MATSSAPLDVDPFFLLHRGDDIHRLGRGCVATSDNVDGEHHVASDDGEHDPGPDATFQLLTEDGVQPYIWATAPSVGINVDSRYQLLYTAAMRGDWGSARRSIGEDENLLTARISIFSWTALHIASGQGHGKFVEQLVRRMSPEAVALRDLGGYTALHYAAKAGSLRCVQAIHRTNPRLTQIGSNSGHVPLHIAAGSSTTPGQKEVVWYLCEVTEYEGPDGPFASPRGFELMWGVIAAEYLDIAIFLIRKYPYLAAPCPEREYDYYVLDMLGQMPFVFRSQSRLGFWESIMSYVVPVKLDDMSPEAHVHDTEQHDGDAMPFLSKLRIYLKLALKLITVPALKRIYEEKSKHKYAIELLNEVFSQAGALTNSEKLHLLNYYNILANAAAKGIVEILRECFEFFPDAVWFTTNYESVLQTCIKYRQEKVFNLLQEVTAQNKLMADRIVLGDTSLHLVAKMAPFDKLKAVSGSALQMQSEIQWFKAVEKLVRPVYLSYRNHDNIAAHELFTKEHEKLLESGEKWMKDTSSSCMVVATLIATVVFAAAFTVPGGNNQGDGVPFFLSKTSFLVFAISDALALFSSTTSILVFLSILISRFAERDFLDALPRRLIIGLASLFFAIVTMLIAFAATLSVVLDRRFPWIAFPVTSLAFLPVGLFAKLQLPLFYQMVKYTFRGSISSQRFESEMASTTEQKKGNVKAKAGGKKKEVKKETGLGLTYKKDDNFGEWYSEVVVNGEMIEYYDISGCYILRPWTMSIWEVMQTFFDAEIKKMKIKNCYFPLFVSPGVLQKEKDHIEGFAPEVAWVTKSGQSDLEIPIAIRPTSETVMYPYYSKWIRGHRDLPLRLNQWCNVVRWEFSHPTPFIRSREFLWQEGHTAFATQEEADAEVLEILELYRQIYEEYLAVPVIKGKKSELEKFAGGYYTTSVEAFIPNTGRGIQGATSHCLGQNFAKMFEITFENDKGEKAMVWQNSWAYSTRTIGVMVMVHGDDKGLVLPPKVAAVQVIVVPVPFKDANTQAIFDACTETVKTLSEAGIRVEADLRDNYSPGWKYSNWEMKGVPLRIEIGPKDLAKSQVRVVRRDNSDKLDIPMADLVDQVKDILSKVQQNLFDIAKNKRDACIKVVKTWDEFAEALAQKKLILAPWCDEEEVEKDVKTRTKGEMGAAKTLCTPFEQPEMEEGTLCFASGKPAKKWTYWGRSY